MNTVHAQKKSCLLIVLLFLMAGINGRAEIFDSTKKKELSETFSASSGDKVKLDNRYGNITVAHWNNPEVNIRVVIEAKGGSEKRAQELLDRVQISLNKAGGTISGITSLGNQSWNGDNAKLIINYYVNMPSGLALSISQKYGNINLPERNEGKTDLEVKYGNIKAGSFTLPLTVEAGYSNVNLGDVQDCSLDLAYCGNVSFNNGKDIKIDNKYSNLKIRNIASLKLDNKYGNIAIQNVDKISMDVKYSEVSIERIKDELIVFSLDYSTLKVGELASTFKKAEVSARYGNFNVSISPNASFRVSAERMKYGNVDVKGFNITNSTVEDKINHHYQINGGGNSIIRFNGNNYSNIRVRAL